MDYLVVRFFCVSALILMGCVKQPTQEGTQPKEPSEAAPDSDSQSNHNPAPNGGEQGGGASAAKGVLGSLIGTGVLGAGLLGTREWCKSKLEASNLDSLSKDLILRSCNTLAQFAPEHPMFKSGKAMSLWQEAKYLKKRAFGQLRALPEEQQLLIYAQNGNLRRLNRLDDVLVPMDNGQYYYVLDLKPLPSRNGAFGVLRAAPVVPHLSPSSLSHGKPVAAAGEMEIKDGKIVWINNEAEGYDIGLVHLQQVLGFLFDHEVLEDRSIVHVARMGSYGYKRWKEKIGAETEEDLRQQLSQLTGIYWIAFRGSTDKIERNKLLAMVNFKEWDDDTNQWKKEIRHIPLPWSQSSAIPSKEELRPYPILQHPGLFFVGHLAVNSQGEVSLKELTAPLQQELAQQGVHLPAAKRTHLVEALGSFVTQHFLESPDGLFVDFPWLKVEMLLQEIERIRIPLLDWTLFNILTLLADMWAVGFTNNAVLEIALSDGSVHQVPLDTNFRDHFFEEIDGHWKFKQHNEQQVIQLALAHSADDHDPIRKLGLLFSH